MKPHQFAVLACAGLGVCLGPSRVAQADNDISVKTVSPPPALTDRDKKQMADEIKQGQDAAADVAKSAKLVKDKAQNDRVDQIGQRLAAVVNTTEIPAGYGNDRVYPFVLAFSHHRR